MSNALGDLIGRGEGSYGSFNRGTAGDAHGATMDFGNMTIGQIQHLQHLPRSDPNRIFTVGKYQIKPDTMGDIVKGMHLNPNEKFTPALQEKIFADYLIAQKRHAIKDYITGKPGATREKALDGLAAEWASVENHRNPGHGRYDSKGNNKLNIKSAEAGRALDAMRDQYQQMIHGNPPMSKEDAWHKVTDRTPGYPQNRGSNHSDGHTQEPHRPPNNAHGSNHRGPTAVAGHTQAPMELTNPKHPGYHDFTVGQEIVKSLIAQGKLHLDPKDQRHIDQLAAAVATEGLKLYPELKQIDHYDVMKGKDGKEMIVLVQKDDPTNHRLPAESHIDVSQGLGTSVSASTHEWNSLDKSQHVNSRSPDQDRIDYQYMQGR